MSADLVLRHAAAAAVMAPSTHNTQPWRFKIAGDALELYADPTRQLVQIDRDFRQLVQSCGCALMNARIAVRAMGYVDDVTVQLANRDLPLHLATLRLGAAHVPTPHEHALMHAISQRGTNRRAFLPRPIAASITDDFAALAAREGVELVRLEPDDKDALAPLVAAADAHQLATPAYRDELERWLTRRGRDGIPFEEKEYGSPRLFARRRTLHARSLPRYFAMLESANVRSAPAVVVLGTERDDPAAWLACGQALEAILLHATTLGLAGAFLNQLLEVPALRTHLASLLPAVGQPQMILRFGIPSAPIARVSRRRALADVLDA